MEQAEAQLYVTLTLGVGLSILISLYWDKIEAYLRKVAPDEKELFRKLFIGGVLLFILIGAAISIYIVFRGFGLSE